MNVERTIEFLLKNQARMDARFNAKFDRADARLTRMERLVEQNNHLVARLARYGVSLRSDLRKNESDVRRTERNLAKVSDSLREMDNKLRALTDRRIRGDGRQK